MTENSPSNADLMDFLPKINTRLENVESKLSKSLEKKIEMFDKYPTNIWNSINEQNNKMLR